MNNKNVFILLAAAIALKLTLYVFAMQYAPDSKFQPDTHTYMESGKNIFINQQFAFSNGPQLFPETVRTPGYPFFLGFFHNMLNISLNGIIFIQMILTLITALGVYLAAARLNSRVAAFAFMLILFDPPTMIYAQILLSETLFTTLLTFFLLSFVLYLKNNRLKFLCLAALFLALATYVRPISYYLGILVAIFICSFIIINKSKKFIKHAILFFAITYMLLGAWQWRNFKQTGQPVFAAIEQHNLKYLSLIKADSFKTAAGEAGHGFINLMTDPGSFKYFGSKPLKQIGKIVSYPWMMVWLLGFLVSLGSLDKNPYVPFLWMMVIYFAGVSVVGAVDSVNARFRVPMMPFIAILCAHGWYILFEYYKTKLRKN